MPEPSTMVLVLDNLGRRGFTANLSVVEGALRVIETGKMLRPEEVVIREHYRFEGESDPDDM